MAVVVVCVFMLRRFQAAIDVIDFHVIAFQETIIQLDTFLFRGRFLSFMLTTFRAELGEAAQAEHVHDGVLVEEAATRGRVVDGRQRQVVLSGWLLYTSATPPRHNVRLYHS